MKSDLILYICTIHWLDEGRFQIRCETFEWAESWGHFIEPLSRDTIQINKMRKGGGWDTMAITLAESDKMLIKW